MPAPPITGCLVLNSFVAAAAGSLSRRPYLDSLGPALGGWDRPRRNRVLLAGLGAKWESLNNSVLMRRVSLLTGWLSCLADYRLH